jgi:hypothetical protein
MTQLRIVADDASTTDLLRFAKVGAENQAIEKHKITQLVSVRNYGYYAYDDHIMPTRPHARARRGTKQPVAPVVSVVIAGSSRTSGLGAPHSLTAVGPYHPRRKHQFLASELRNFGNRDSELRLSVVSVSVSNFHRGHAYALE